MAILVKSESSPDFMRKCVSNSKADSFGGRIPKADLQTPHKHAYTQRCTWEVKPCGLGLKFVGIISTFLLINFGNRT